jgi:DNA polymerase-1
MIKVQALIDREAPQVKMLLTVHDELVLEAPETQAESVSERLRSVMEQAAELAVPLKVDLGVGRTWADAK